MRTIVLRNGVTLEPVVRRGVFLGWGAIRAGGSVLRSGRRPMFVEIRNPYGVRLREFRLTRRADSARGVSLEFSMLREQGGIMDWMVHSVRNRYAATDWTERPCQAADTRLTVDLRPASRVLGGRRFVGFRYQYHYRSRSVPIYKILDRGTWEPGGRAVGNEFWMRNCFTPSVVALTSRGQFHSTEWYLPSCENPSIFQFLPLQTELQGFTFTARDAGVLVTWVTRVAHVRSLFEKPRGRDEIVHWHEHCGDLALRFETAPVEVLWLPGATSRVERANIYEDVKEMVHSALHAGLGMRRERVTTYGVIEEWTDADLARYRRLGLPKLLDAGTKTVYIANHFQNNMNTWGVGNMCNTVDYQVARSVGETRLRAFCRRAHRGGARVEMWGNTSISSLTWRFARPDGRPKGVRFLPSTGSITEAIKAAEMPFVRNPSNAIEADHYTPEFCVLNLRDATVRGYWMRRWKQAHDRVGLDGVFLDSSFNLSSDKFHWVQNATARQAGATADQTHLLGHYRPACEPPAAILSQYRAHLDLMAAMQRAGYHYCNEDLGVFGVHRHGPAVTARLDCLWLWTDCLATFDVPAIAEAGRDPDDVFFRGLAYRMMWQVCWDIAGDRLSFHYYGARGDHDLPRPWHLALLKAYNAIERYLVRRTILPDEAAVLYAGGQRRVLWCFRDMRAAFAAPTPLKDVLSGTVARARAHRLGRHRIYTWTGTEPQVHDP